MSEDKAPELPTPTKTKATLFDLGEGACPIVDGRFASPGIGALKPPSPRSSPRSTPLPQKKLEQQAVQQEQEQLQKSQ